MSIVNMDTLREENAEPQEEFLTPDEQQVFYLWEENNVPAETVYTENNGGYFDDPDFRPYLTSFPVPEGTGAAVPGFSPSR